MYLPNNTLLQGGKYKIVRHISKGGFGLTYEGIHTMMNTRVAIKEFYGQKFCSRDETTSQVTVGPQVTKGQFEKLIKKFKEEAAAVFNMKHDNIVRVLDIFEENGTAYYIMEYIDGKSLKNISEERGALPEAEAVGYIRQIADALKYVHSLDRLHLDIKPGNIMVNNKGKAILIDFGASKHYDKETGENDSTLMGIYSEHYSPIEQLNRTFTLFSPSADIYALGATLYKLVTGITPPEASLLASGETLDIPASLSASTRNAILQSMQTNKMKRPQSIDEFLKLLSLGSDKNGSSFNENFGNSTFVNQGNKQVDDESTRIETSAWQEEEARRQREFQAKAEREAKEREEARRHPEEVERKSREGIRNPSTTSRKRDNQSTRSSSKGKIGCVIISVIVVLIFILILGSNQSSNGGSLPTYNEVTNQQYEHKGESVSYSGEVNKYGIPHGKGVGIYPHGKYEGYYLEGERHGQGKFTDKEGGVFTGSFANDEYNNGKYVMKDGTYYEGIFKNQQPYNGTWYNKNGTVISRVVNGN